MEPRRVVISVGTDHHPFDRLVRWADSWSSEHPGSEVFIQYGTSATPLVARGASIIPHGRLLDEMRAADVVITHGGPVTISDAWQCGHVPVVVPREPGLGEHVDDHQVRFASFLATSGRVDLARDHESFAALLASWAERRSTHEAPQRTGSPPDSLARFAEAVVWLEARPRRRWWPGRPLKPSPEARAGVEPSDTAADS